MTIRHPALFGLLVLVLMFMVIGVGTQVADFGPESAALTTMIVPDLHETSEPLSTALNQVDLHVLTHPNSAIERLNGNNRWTMAKIGALPVWTNSDAIGLDLITAMRHAPNSASYGPDIGAAPAMTATGVPNQTIESTLGMA